MAQLVKIGRYLVEIDGTHLTFFDVAGNPQGQPQDLSQGAQIILPDGTPLPIEQMAELLAGDADALANFQTAAGAPARTDLPATEANSGGGRFAAFEDQQGIGGLVAVGGLAQTELTFQAQLQDANRPLDDQANLPPALTSIFETPREDETPASHGGGAPQDNSSGNNAPGNDAPGHQPPSNNAPDNDAPSNLPPSNDAPQDNSDSNNAPDNDAPGDQPPSNDAPLDNSSSNNAPDNDAPGDQPPSNDAPLDNSSSNNAPDNDAPSDLPPSNDTPQDNHNSDPGTDDVLHLNVRAMGKDYDLGAGYDTVQLGHGNMDFGAEEAGHLKNIEVIDAKGAGHNDISLSIDDVVDMTEGGHHLTIIGHKGDSLQLTGDGNHSWTVTDHGADFTTYSYNDGVHQAVVEVSNVMAQVIV